MKRWIALILMALAVGITSALATKPQNVTLVVDDVPVTQVLQALAEQEQKTWWFRRMSAVCCRCI